MPGRTVASSVTNIAAPSTAPVAPSMPKTTTVANQSRLCTGLNDPESNARADDASSAPPSPAMSELVANRKTFESRHVDTDGAGAGLVVAHGQQRSSQPASMEVAHQEQRTAQAHELEDVEVVLAAEQVGRARHDAADEAGLLEHEPTHHFADREGREGEEQPAPADGGPAGEESDRNDEKGPDRKGHEVADMRQRRERSAGELRGQQRTETGKPRGPEGDLAAVAAQHDDRDQDDRERRNLLSRAQRTVREYEREGEQHERRDPPSSRRPVCTTNGQTAGGPGVARGADETADREQRDQQDDDEEVGGESLQQDAARPGEVEVGELALRDADGQSRPRSRCRGEPTER